MLLYLLRHAEAVSDATSDHERQLTDKGVRQAKVVGDFCRAHSIAPAAILTSPSTRALKTAEIVARKVGLHQPIIEPFLSPGMTPQTAIDGIAAYRAMDPLMIVGHQPDLGALLHSLLGLQAEADLAVRKASLTALELPAFRNACATLLFSLPNRLMRV